MNNLFISYSYYAFYNKYQVPAWTSGFHAAYKHVASCFYDALSSDAIEEVEIDDGQIVDRRWILHHFDFTSFIILVFLMTLVCPLLVLEIW